MHRLSGICVYLKKKKSNVKRPPQFKLKFEWDTCRDRRALKKHFWLNENLKIFVSCCNYVL